MAAESKLQLVAGRLQQIEHRVCCRRFGQSCVPAFVPLDAAHKGTDLLRRRVAAEIHAASPGLEGKYQKFSGQEVEFMVMK